MRTSGVAGLVLLAIALLTAVITTSQECFLLSEACSQHNQRLLALRIAIAIPFTLSGTLLLLSTTRLPRSSGLAIGLLLLFAGGTILFAMFNLIYCFPGGEYCASFWAGYWAAATILLGTGSATLVDSIIASGPRPATSSSLLSASAATPALPHPSRDREMRGQRR